MMNQQEILRKIGLIILELQDQQQYLTQTSKINLLELELFTANADFLIDHIEILKKLNHQGNEQKALDEHHSVNEPTSRIETVTEMVLVSPPDIPHEEEDEVLEIFETPLKEPFFDFSFEEEPTEMVFDFEKKVPVEEVFDRPLSSEEIELLESKTKALEEVIEVVADDLIIEEEEGPEPFLISNVVDEQEIVAEVEEEIFEEVVIQNIEIPAEVKVENPVKTETKLTLNEMLSAKKEQKNSIGKTGNNIDLKSAISLNDKMIFIKELFNGYNLAYSEAVEIVNRFESFEAADNFLTKNYAKKNNWTNKQETVDRFYDYLNRKFGV